MSERKPVKANSRNKKDSNEEEDELLTVGVETSEGGSNLTITEMTIAELSKKLQRERQDLERSQRQLRSHQNVISRLLKALNEVRGENRNLGDKKKQLEQQAAESEEGRRQRDTQVLELENRLQIVKADLVRAEMQSNEQSEAVDAANARIAELEKLCREKDAEIIDLKELVADVQNKLATQQTVIDDLQARLKDADVTKHEVEALGLQMVEVMKALGLTSFNRGSGPANDAQDAGSAEN